MKTFSNDPTRILNQHIKLFETNHRNGTTIHKWL